MSEHLLHFLSNVITNQFLPCQYNTDTLTLVRVKFKLDFTYLPGFDCVYAFRLWPSCAA